MLRHGIRLSVAILTFTLGIIVVWALHLVPRLETALLDRYFGVPEIRRCRFRANSFDYMQDSNQIYRLLVQQKYAFKGETELIVLKAETTTMFEERSEDGGSATFKQAIQRLMPEVESQTLDDYWKSNETSETLRVSSLGIPYVLVSNEYLHNDQFDRFWGNFYKRFSDSSGLVSFSKVGFNEQHDQAFVYAGRTCGGLCGAGGYVLLKKVNGQWKIEKDEGLWVS